MLLAFLAVALPANGQDFDKGLTAAKKGNFEVALRKWQPLAKKGDVDAQYNLAVMYANGQGVPKDTAEARKWLREPVMRGHAGAQFLLGLMFAHGLGVERDLVKAVSWYRKAAA